MPNAVESDQRKLPAAAAVALQAQQDTAVRPVRLLLGGSPCRPLSARAERSLQFEATAQPGRRAASVGCPEPMGANVGLAPEPRSPLLHSLRASGAQTSPVASSQQA